ncbi:glycoside hydrolase family 38 C-terminal domain-containing protein [Anaerocolumna sp. MB42-C2]|uniref:glycoside hydrolase family 38 N-terminal domain-containing protein n=1 Tax=Anaerocolumna sp. MB42-C2 TaxID=3070997 RepID=UPI0027E0E8D4|nr:alpha-mannosidase [Anaerocolumna sp. MB42-C2]WMJ86392.1 glycoside hydrolase family 38 C-terminal domain-containing protein [Anaerocolumna sp. MB42-C2]
MSENKKVKNVHLIANAHLDPVWLWRWQEGCSEALSTFRTASELTEEFNGFVFNHNEAILYEWVKENDITLYNTIKKQIQDGKWHIMGGWFLQPDCNMPSGESIIRNIQVGQRFYKKEFGVVPTTAINFDSFGHSRGLVQILSKAGYDSYLVCRPAADWYDFKDQDFIWRGFADSSVIVHRSDENYNSVWGDAAKELDQFLEQKKEEEVTLCLWGVGDHGGGPTRKDLRDLKIMIENSEEYHIKHSVPEAYFEELREKNPDLHEVSASLNPVAPGCYTSQIRVKQKHRLLENEYYSAEKMATAAEVLNHKPYPKEIFHEIEKALLFSEFHDALPGSGSPLVEEDTIRLLDHGLELVSRMKHYTALALAEHEDKVKPDSSVILMYNPHPYDITGVFACEVGLPKQNWTSDFMYPEVTAEGNKIPTQAEKECSNFSIDWRKKVVVQATLKAFSMNRFDVTFKPMEKRPVFSEIVSKPLYVFENDRMKVVINTTTGLLEEYYVDGICYLTKGSFMLSAFDDTSNPWGIGTMESSGRRNFSLLLPHEGSEYSGLTSKVIPSVRIIEDGEVRTTIEAVFGLHNSKSYIRYQLPKKGTDFDVELGVLFLEKEQFLKLTLNIPEADNKFSGQIMFGSEELKQGEETVSQKWVMVSDKDKNAVAVLNKGTYGASYMNGELGVTLLRSAGYTASDFIMGKALQEEQWAPRMEQGERFYQFRITAGNKKELDNRLDQMALAYNEEPYAFAYCPPGYIEPGVNRRVSFLTIDNPNVILSALKKSEDRDGYIMRLYENSGKSATAVLNILDGRLVKEIKLNANEIKTFFISVKDSYIEETSLIEMDLGNSENI